MIVTLYADAQTITTDTGKKAAAPPARFQRIMTPEQRAAAEAQAKAQEAAKQKADGAQN